jgi:hypothetical protein
MRKRYRPLLIQIFFFLALHFTAIVSSMWGYNDDLLTSLSIRLIQCTSVQQSSAPEITFMAITLTVSQLAVAHYLASTQHNDFLLYRN